MATSKASTVAEYLASLPPEQRAQIAAVRDVVNANLPAGYQEGMQYGMIGWAVPLSRYPDTYNGQPLGLVGLAAQKNYNAIYLMTVYGDPQTGAWFFAEYKKSGKKLDMGKSCLRFKAADDIPLDLIGRLVARVPVDHYIDRVVATHAAYRKAKVAKRPARKPTRKAAPKKSTRRPAVKKSSRRGRSAGRGRRPRARRGGGRG